MSDQLRRLAVALGEGELSPAEVQLVLDLARDVAHATERPLAPLSTFLAGLWAGQHGDREAALRDAAEILRRALPPDVNAGTSADQPDG